MSNMPDQRRGPWSAGEDQRLIKLVKDLGPGNWVNVARILGTRTPKQCRERWHQNLKPGLNHGPMTQEEAAIIVREVDLKGPRWADIARKLQGRSDNAVKNYWNGLNNRKKNQLRRQSAPRRVSASDVLRSSPGQLPRAHMQRPIRYPQDIYTGSRRPSSPSSFNDSLHHRVHESIEWFPSRPQQQQQQQQQQARCTTPFTSFYPPSHAFPTTDGYQDGSDGPTGSTLRLLTPPTSRRLAPFSTLPSPTTSSIGDLDEFDRRQLAAFAPPAAYRRPSLPFPQQSSMGYLPSATEYLPTAPSSPIALIQRDEKNHARIPVTSLLCS
ncbi:hypothetical protein GE21DRAFT_7739 [Neurospora crassa]|uniref:Myb-like DNA-binding protein myb-1 n=1 Tax=Neurospora crassa (strain ATCC 24698 / 74-OR23-1A / CBS 708.71 / DSM 1257 / FGSC 987) TaxID=367110 RepID=MYB1_NEUCR|nr:myb-like DNA-binding protein myb-1 [Neurospora crassa OR74A]O13493.2 RecName: Full=Myb-like DNA-binding protein myb-1 [Neurospora crassa OR74A]EAA32162.1 myb-like DNA-binding protein myb-1 [Neurospora crassa OR74A]KHE83498.1 hypothetical protein GE21DRAFT_7739 [Neurospora crassa]CAC18298.1 regulator of conidiation rca-1 [Neurospora crassa]|eukprot:XP_961398.1 myb-like DNA-binding protein myb-1 [Neurospora crassa OR74A]